MIRVQAFSLVAETAVRRLGSTLEGKGLFPALTITMPVCTLEESHHC